MTDYRETDTRFHDNLDYTFEDLDTSWLSEFEKMNKENQICYTENLLFVKVNYIYVNCNQEITNVGEEKYFFKKTNTMTKEDLIGLIKRSNIINHRKYSLLSILKYNINIEPHNLKLFFKSKTNIGNTYLQSIKNIDDIVFEKSINIFHDLNNVIIIFIEKDSNISKSNSSVLNATKRIYINQLKKYGNNGNNSINGINGNNNGNNLRYKKTRRNLFKDNL